MAALTLVGLLFLLLEARHQDRFVELIMLSHPVAQLSWTRFTVHPSTVIGIAALGLAYAWRVRRGPSVLDHPAAAYRTAASPAGPTLAGPSTGQRASFITSLLLLFLTLNGPLHDLSDTFSFSAHMVQHLIIMTLVIPPLMIWYAGVDVASTASAASDVAARQSAHEFGGLRCDFQSGVVVLAPAARHTSRSSTTRFTSSST